MTQVFDVLADGVRTRLTTAGDRSSPTLLLVHDGAFGTTGDLCWGPVQLALADDFFVVVPDLVGWGGSDKTVSFDRSPYEPRLRQLAGLCGALCLNDDPIHLAGVSFGAELVVRACIEPEWGIRVRAAVSIAGTGGRLYRVDSAMHSLTNYEPSVQAAKELTELLAPAVADLDAHAEKRYQNSLIPGHWEALSATRIHNPALPRHQPDDAWMERLSTTTVPITFVEGRDDKLMEPGWAQRIAGRVPGSEWLVVDGGHEPNLDHPAEIAEVLRKCLRP